MYGTKRNIEVSRDRVIIQNLKVNKIDNCKKETNSEEKDS